MFDDQPISPLRTVSSGRSEGIENKTAPGKLADRDFYQMTEDKFLALGIRRPH
ncbi:MAG: hypothetical protein RIC16_15195 [Rhodospirillales bacterium]